RAGRLRPPVFINTQNAEVGVTYDPLRLPVEVYSLSPVYDADGAAITRTWTLGEAQVDMDAYWGKTDIKYRLPFQRFTDQIYFPETITLSGIVLSYTSGPLFLRGGVHRASVEPRSGGLFYRTIDPITIGVPPPLGGVLYVPVDPLDRIGISVLTLGAEWHSGEWSITGE